MERMSDMKPLIFKIVYFLALPVIMGCSGHNGRLLSDQGNQEEITQDSTVQSVITFSKLSHDFGTILEGEKVVTVLSNASNEVVKLTIKANIET